jgi:hypothetical protein
LCHQIYLIADDQMGDRVAVPVAAAAIYLKIKSL